MHVVESDTQTCYIPLMTGNELKEKRTKIGLSQQKLSQLLEVSLSTVARWEQLEKDLIPNSKMLDLALQTIERELSKEQ